MNTSSYPRIHYPEVYILKGGYCQYYKSSAINCEPRAYVPMNHPEFARDRREDFDQFRKARFGRTRSYAYGESKMMAPSQPSSSHSNRNSAPNVGNGVNSLFAAASAARTRRVVSTGDSVLSTLVEDSNTTLTSSDDGTEESNGVECSPCPPQSAKMFVSNAMHMAMLGSKRNSGGSGRGPLQRAQTFAQIR